MFRLYLVGMLGQWSSMNMQIVARSLLVYRISGSGTILGLTSLANAIPTIVISLMGGALADRLQKKNILVFCQTVSMLTSLAVALALTFGYLGEAREGSWWILVVTAAIQGATMGLLMPARQAIVPEIVAHDQVMNAISLNMMGMNAFRMLAPAVTGFIIDAWDFNVIYYVSTAMYGLAAFCMLLLPKTKAILSHGQSALLDIVDGVRYIRREKTILLVLVATLFTMVCGLPFAQLLPMITEDILDVGASGMGILLTVSGAGAIAGSLVLASLPNRKRGIIMLVSGILMGVSLVVFSFSRMWVLSLVLVIFIGLGQTGNRTAGNALAQNYTDPEYRGRVMSFMMMGLGFSSLGTFFAGVVAEAVGIEWAMSGLAVLLIIVSLMLLGMTARVRRME